MAMATALIVELRGASRSQRINSVTTNFTYLITTSRQSHSCPVTELHSFVKQSTKRKVLQNWGAHCHGVYWSTRGGDRCSAVTLLWLVVMGHCTSWGSPCCVCRYTQRTTKAIPLEHPMITAVKNHASLQKKVSRVHIKLARRNG